MTPPTMPPVRDDNPYDKKWTERTITIPRWMFMLMIAVIAIQGFLWAANTALNLMGVPK